MNQGHQADIQPETGAAGRATRTQWHRILARLLELLLTPLGVTVQTELPIMSEPPKADILLVRRSGVRWSEAQLRLLCDGLRNVLAATLLIEFKFSESLSLDALRQALAYDYFYRMAQRLAESEVATFIMVARTPRVRVLRELGYEASELPGVYRSRQPLQERVQIIVLNELRAETHNAFVQQFASKRRVRQAAFVRLSEEERRELSDAVRDLLFGLQGQFDLKEDEMGKVKQSEEVVTPESVMKLGRELRRSLIAGLKPEERLAGLAPQERLAGLTPEERKALFVTLPPQERLAGLAPQERLAGLAPQERLAGLTPEDLAELLEQIEASLLEQSK